MVEEVRLNSPVQQQGMGQFRDLEAFVFYPEELVRLPGAVAEHDPGGVSTCGCEVYHIRS